MDYNELLRKAEQHWDREVVQGCGFTVPALRLTREMIEEYIAGRRADLQGVAIENRELLRNVQDKEVLCLASGGGQQSAVFGLLGAHVTVLDLSEGQLKGDRTTAQHYGYQVNTVKGDMSDLSAFADASFDLVYQIHSIAWIPDVRAVYREVYRVLRPGGLYGVVHNNPAIHPATFSGGLAGWDGVGYRIADRYKGGPILKNRAGVENMEEGEPTGDNRHLLRTSSVGCWNWASSFAK